MGEEQRVALIVASAQGIGRATARRMAAAGYRLCMVDHNGETLERTAAELRAGGAEVLTVVADATLKADVQRYVDAAKERYGRIDALANVAGGAGNRNLHQVDEIDEDAWDLVINLNLKSTYLACHYVVPIMRRQQYGRIVNLSSTVGRGRFGPIGTMGIRLPYATAKAGILGFTSQLAKDVGAFGITVNAVMPWLTLGEPGTKIREKFDGLPEELRKWTVALSPQGRTMTADGVAAAMAFLLSEDAGFVSGVGLPVDGAYLN